MSRSIQPIARKALALRWAAPLSIFGVLAACNDRPAATAPAPVPASLDGANLNTTPTLKIERILFSAITDSGSRIFRVEPDGSNLAQVPTKGIAFAPSWSADRTKITFTRPVFGMQKVMVMYADGSGLKQLVTGEYPRFRPDGTKIAFQRSVNGGPPQIFIMDPDGTDVEQLTHNPHGAYWPSWSPGGERIAYTAAAYDGGPLDLEIWWTNHSGVQQHQITYCNKLQGVRCAAADWAMVGTEQRLVYSVSPGTANVSQIRTSSWGGSDETVVTNVPKVPGNKFPVWSRDRTQIAYFDKQNASADWPDIFIVNLDGSNQTRLTTMDVPKSRASW